MGSYLRLSAWAILVVSWLLIGCWSPGMIGGVLVGPDEAAVVMDKLSGEVEVYLPGSRFSFNSATQSVTFYSLALQEYQLFGMPDDTDATEANAITARTLDGQSIWLEVVVLYRIDPQQVGSVHIRWWDRYPSDFMRPMMRGIVREVAATYNAFDTFGAEREAMEQAMQDRISDAFAAEGFILVDFLIRDIQFTKEYTQQIEATLIFQMTEEAQTPTPPHAEP